MLGTLTIRAYRCPRCGRTGGLFPEERVTERNSPRGATINITLVHSFYDDRAPSGENRVVEAQARALRRAGHDVDVASIRTSDVLDEPFFSSRAALRVATGRGRAPDISDDPDVVHVHNLFPNYGRQWIEGLDHPLVATLHNFRPVCAQPMLLRDGQICTLCPDGDRWASLRYACYRGSRIRTLPLTIAMTGGPMADPLLRRADRLLVMNQKMLQVYAAAGVPSRKMTVAPNFLEETVDPGRALDGQPESGAWLFVGRLGREKGIRRLIEVWPTSHRLVVIGAEGEDEESVRRTAGSSVDICGALGRDEVLGLMQDCVGLVFPSLSYEGSPLVYVEALSCGLPVLAFEPTALASTVVTEGTGMPATWDQDLTKLLDLASDRFPRLRARCREVFDATYSEGAFVARAERLYRDVAA